MLSGNPDNVYLLNTNNVNVYFLTYLVAITVLQNCSHKQENWDECRRIVPANIQVAKGVINSGALQQQNI